MFGNMFTYKNTHYLHIFTCAAATDLRRNPSIVKKNKIYFKR